MSKNSNVNVGCGGELASMLTVLFVGLKLTGYIAWSWWWVLSPMWILAVFVLFVFLLWTIWPDVS
jgi:uncharacterized protein (DUF983 family)